MTPEKLRSHLFEDPEFDMSTSVCMRDVENHVLIGFSGVKLSGISNCIRIQHGFPFAVLQKIPTLWIWNTAFAKTLQQLREKGIHKVFLGQDFANFFPEFRSE